MCQKSAGSVVVAWMDFHTEQVTWTSGRPTEFESSQSVRRGFCAQCGSTLSFRDVRHPQYLTLTIASLDDPNWVEPKQHIYVDSQVQWLHITDNCQRFPKGPEK